MAAMEARAQVSDGEWKDSPIEGIQIRATTGDDGSLTVTARLALFAAVTIKPEALTGNGVLETLMHASERATRCLIRDARQRLQGNEWGY